ncbi:MAG TPA: DUF6348 family protein [Polyangiaceae bacterium]|jgi:hypothetical protein
MLHPALVVSPDDSWPSRVRRALLPELNAIAGKWFEEGDSLRDDNALVRVTNRHPGGPGHIDVGFVLSSSGGAFAVWDCVAGGQAEDEDAATFAARLWSQTTAPVLLELRSQREDLATNSLGDPALGLSGWHSVHGPIVAYGSGDGALLQEWLLEHPVVPLLGETLRKTLLSRGPHGVKFVLGDFDEPIAEVRIDGVRNDACCDALLALPWPRARRSCAARFFVLFVHPIER